MDMDLFRHNHARFVAFDLIDRNSTLLHVDRYLTQVTERWQLANSNSKFIPSVSKIDARDNMQIYIFTGHCINGVIT
jgi:hypothetical protein